MKRLWIHLFVFFFGAAACLAVEVEESIKQEKAEYVSNKVNKADFVDDKTAKPDRSNSKNKTRVITSRSKPQKVSLEEYFEYGMVPVENLEAQLSEGAVAATKTLGVNRGKYYTVYSKVSGGDSSSSDSGNEAEFENIEFTEDEEESDDDEPK